MKSLSELKVKLFADGADVATICELSKNPLIKGFTTNPTLMRKAGVKDYEAFAKEILAIVDGRPISFEVFDDSFTGMEKQARKIASWGENVYVKIPVMNTAGHPSLRVIRRLSRDGIKVNVTAVMRVAQAINVYEVLESGVPAYISIFAGRIADTGRDPVPMIEFLTQFLDKQDNTRLIWASPRELLNVFQANDCGCHIITATSDILKKLSLVGKSLEEYSLETVQMFHRDARESGYVL